MAKTAKTPKSKRAPGKAALLLIEIERKAWKALCDRLHEELAIAESQLKHAREELVEQRADNLWLRGSIYRIADEYGNASSLRRYLMGEALEVSIGLAKARADSLKELT